MKRFKKNINFGLTKEDKLNIASAGGVVGGTAGIVAMCNIRGAKKTNQKRSQNCDIFTKKANNK